MADLRIRWRLGGSSAPAKAAAAVQSPDLVRIGLLVWAAVALIVGLGLAARLYNVNWDADNHLHPDERHITIVTNDLEWPGSVGGYFDTAASPLNPYNRDGTSFVYGTFPVYLTKAVAGAVGMDDYDGLAIVGRYLAGSFAGATVLLVFLLGRKLYGPLAGLFGAVFMASAPLAIQHAHFFVVDSFLTFFVVAALYFSVRIVQEGRSLDYGLAGLAVGLGIACKLTALILLLVLVLAVAVRLWPLVVESLRTGRLPTQHAYARQALRGLGLALVIGLLAFRVAQPYAFEKPTLSNLGFAVNQRFVDDQQSQVRLLGGEVGFPPSVQWIGRESYIFPLQQMVRWGMGPAFGIVGWAGLLYAAYRVVRYRELRHLLLVAFVLAYFGVMGRQFSLYLRYFLPLYPALAVLGGFLLADLVRGAAFLGRRLQLPGAAFAARGFAGAVLAFAALGGLAYVSVYTKPVTRLEASAWMRENLPAGAAIAVEHWDDRIPAHAEDRFAFVELAMYEPDTPTKVEELLDGLDRADYLVLSSNRLLVSIPRNEVNYPVSRRYYELLLKEELGFSRLRSFTSYPRLLGVELPDHATEESFSSYDHPRVLLFEKTPDYSRERLDSLLGDGPFAAAVLNPAQADKNGLLLRQDDLAIQRAGGTWSDVFKTDGIVRSHPTLLWLLAVEAAALTATPIAMSLFRRLPDRGYLLAKPLGLLLLAYPVWLLVSLKVVHFEQATVLAWLGVLLMIAGATVMLRWDDFAAALGKNWRLYLFAEALFLSAFLFAYELRVLNPDLWHPFRGGEKPMDLAYFTAVTRSTTLPPFDPWFSGGYINYYYLGQFFAASLTKLTSIPPAVAYNLAVPTFYAFTVGAAFSISYNLAAAARRLLRRRPGLRPLPSGSLLFAGLLGAVFVALAGNLDGVGQLAERLSAVSPWQVSSSIPLVGSVANSIGGLWQVVVHGADLREFDFWAPSRMLRSPDNGLVDPITEFPYFSFLFADLHAHLMAIPFALLAIGVSLSLVLGRREERGGAGEWLTIALLGLVVGSLRWLNSWDYPPFLLLALAAVLISERRAEGGVLATIPRVVAKGLLLAGLSLVFFLPFLANYATPVAGVRDAPESTAVHQYLAHFGVFVAAIGVWLLYQIGRVLARAPLVGNDRPRLGVRFRLLAAAAAMALLVLGLVIAGQPTVAALAPAFLLVLYLAGREFRRVRPDGGLRLFLLALIALGLGLSMGVDLVTIEGDIDRMNTVFKFYLHVWLLFGLVASFAVWYLVFVIWSGVPASLGLLSSRRLPGIAVGGALGLLVFAALIYPVFATPVRLDDRFADRPRTLDGTAFMRDTVYNERRGPIDLSRDLLGIQWLRKNVVGTPAIVEGRGDLYSWGSRFSIYTGLPTVLGWDWHQRQQRGDLAFMVDERARQVDAFYGEADVEQALGFLERYGVEYVIVGEIERLYYPPEGLAKFDSGLDGAIEVVYENADLRIFGLSAATAAYRLP